MPNMYREIPSICLPYGSFPQFPTCETPYDPTKPLSTPSAVSERHTPSIQESGQIVGV